MKPSYFLTIIILFIASMLDLAAQDKIVKRDGETIICKVIEIGSKEVKYSLAEYEFQVQFSVEKRQVEKIIFENGNELVIDHAAEAKKSTESNSADLFLVQHKNAIKISFLGPLFGTTSFGYERAIKPGQSIEAEIGIIGLAFDLQEDAGGVGFSAGYKFIRSPDFYLEGMRYAHILKGGYIRPEIRFASYELKADNLNITKFAVVLNIGKQWVFSDVFLVDFFFGFGYGYTNQPENTDHYPYYFQVGKEIPFAGSAGFRIGILL